MIDDRLRKDAIVSLFIVIFVQATRKVVRKAYKKGRNWLRQMQAVVPLRTVWYYPQWYTSAGLVGGLSLKGVD